MRRVIVVVLLVALLLSAGASCAAECGRATAAWIAGFFEPLCGMIVHPGIEGGEGGSIH